MADTATATAEFEPMVVDLASRIGPQRTVAVLGDSGVFKDDESRGAAAAAKRINRALFADFSKDGLSDALLVQIKGIQEKYRPLVSEAPFEQLVQNNTLNNLLDEYISFLIAKSSEKLERLQKGELKGGDELNPTLLNSMIDQTQKELVDLKGEQKTYQSGSDYTKAMLRLVEPAVKHEAYLPLAQLLIEANLVKADGKQQAQDLISDVLSVMPARRIALLAKRMGDGESLARLEQDPASPTAQTRIDALAEAVRQNTDPLSSRYDFQKQSAEVDRLNAMEQLVSAQLHEAFSQKRPLAGMIQLEKDTQKLLQHYAQTAMSFSYDYLNIGPAKDDSRVLKIRANLKQEMDNYGIADLGLDAAIAKAKELARASAENLLQANQNDPAAVKKIETLAQMTGVDIAAEPLAAKSGLIGIPLSEILAKENVIVDPGSYSFVEALERQKQAAVAAGTSRTTAA